MPALYDLGRVTEVPEHLSPVERMALAEKLDGTIKAHVGYAVRGKEARGAATGRNRALVPHLKGLRAADLARALAQGQSPKLSFGGLQAPLSLPREAARLIAAVDGRRSLQEIATVTGTDPIGMGALWSCVERELGDHGLLLYSSILRR